MLLLISDIGVIDDELTVKDRRNLMGNGNFGRLERVHNIREHWPREDSDFTPWLATEESIEILSQAIGVELEVLDQERNVGPFRADVLCKNTADNSLVLIENQFGRTDHSHLGQLFTYAAGLDAVTLIWIVETFTEEHRAAIDWLNRITDEKYYFFGIEIELWTIGDSPPAPKFNIVSKPNDWSKTVKETAEVNRSKLTPWQQSQIAFWKNLGHISKRLMRHSSLQSHMQVYGWVMALADHTPIWSWLSRKKTSWFTYRLTVMNGQGGLRN